MQSKRSFETVDQVVEAMTGGRYIADRPLATVLFLASRLGKPLFLEGEPGVGKTEVALVMSRLFRTKLIRLQCYEGLDASTALYEWNYPKQLLHIRMAEQEDRNRDAIEQMIYGPEFLVQRPLLEAISADNGSPPILLIDEVDRADEEFEAFLLEILADFQITIPEIGTLKAAEPPMVVVTSNRTRDVHDALKRRCLYHWIDYPSFDKEYRILTARYPSVEKSLALQITRFMQRLRQVDFLKRPGVSETLDWAAALIAMERTRLDPSLVEETLGCILKYRDDIRRFREEVWSDPETRSGYLEETGGS